MIEECHAQFVEMYSLSLNNPIKGAIEAIPKTSMEPDTKTNKDKRSNASLSLLFSFSIN